MLKQLEKYSKNYLFIKFKKIKFNIFINIFDKNGKQLLFLSYGKIKIKGNKSKKSGDSINILLNNILKFISKKKYFPIILIFEPDTKFIINNIHNILTDKNKISGIIYIFKNKHSENLKLKK